MKINTYSQTDQGRPSRQAPETATGKAAPADSLASLPAGQLVAGRVVRVEEDGRVLLAIGKESIVARTAVPLTAGSEHWFEVQRGGAEPWLALAAGKGAALELLRLLAAENTFLDKALQLLLGRGAGQQASWPAPTAALRQQLAGQLASGASGNQADPAAVISSLLLLQSPDGQKSGSFRRRLGELLAMLPVETTGRKEMTNLARVLALCQEINQQPVEADRYFLFPCVLTGGAGWGEWMFSLESDRKEAAGAGISSRLSFFLHLSRLGDLHLQMEMQGNAVRGRFFTPDEQARQHLERYLPELRACLKNLGFEPGGFSCLPAERNLLQEWQGELNRHAGLQPLALVDIRA